MNTVVDQKLSSFPFTEIFPFACVIFVAEKKSKLKNTLFCEYRIAMIVPKNSLNTSNATLRTQNDRKCYSQWWHVLFLQSWLDKVCIFFKYLSAESCDSLLSWPCVNLRRLSHQTTINKNNFCLLDITVDTFFSWFYTTVSIFHQVTLRLHSLFDKNLWTRSHIYIFLAQQNYQKYLKY